jgi:hypothetical protein
MIFSVRTATIFALTAAAVMPAFADDAHIQSGSILEQLPKSPEQMVSIVPPNGDQNPYGVAFVPPFFPGGGLLAPGDILVSNFNNGDNAQGTGTTIVKITPNGTPSVFFQGQTGLGLTTALGVLSAGYVLVGNTPAPEGTAEKARCW